MNCSFSRKDSLEKQEALFVPKEWLGSPPQQSEPPTGQTRRESAIVGMNSLGSNMGWMATQVEAVPEQIQITAEI